MTDKNKDAMGEALAAAKGKKCSRCHVQKPLWAFPVAKSGRPGNRCLACRDTKTKRDPRPDEPKSTCICCGEDRPKSMFVVYPLFGSRAHRTLKACSICRKAPKRRPEASIAASANLNAGRLAHRLTAGEVRGRMEMTGWRCWYCRDQAKGVDHVVPLGRGGKNIPSNLVACCTDCNRRKKDRILSAEGMRRFAAEALARRMMHKIALL